jgi:predicted enzyme related to lactoylglutathione lyase
MLVLISPFISLSGEPFAQQQPSSPKEEKDKAPSNPASPNPPDGAATERHDRLRQPGFVFVELFTQDLSGYIDFFQTVAGFKLNRKEGTFVQLQSERSEILLNSTKDFPKSHPFRDKVIGNGQVVMVEIGIVVADLDKSHAAAQKFKGWTIIAGIVRQPWGPRDFRVLSPDGYYLRFTEPSP